MEDELIKDFFTSFNPIGVSSLSSAINQSKASTSSKWNELLSSQRLPVEGWSDAAIEAFLLELSALDGNNFEGVVGLGEREGRVFNSLIKRRQFGYSKNLTLLLIICDLFRFAHGMGRSGNLKDSQPKALGSTILSQLTHKLVLSALRTWGFGKKILAGGLNIMPVCTGMSVMLALMAVESPYRKVIWLRIDQKSCLKAIIAANYEVVMVEGKIEGDEIVTDLEEIKRVIDETGGQVHAIVSCVSCFAPRAPDSIVQISQIAKEHAIAHIVNAAYGGASSRACNLLNAVEDSKGRIDAVVMSLDKNFMVPVGGAILFGSKGDFIKRIAGRYAGRASLSHIIDLFVTLVSLGRKGLAGLKEERIDCFKSFKGQLSKIEGIKLMETPHNDISMALRLPAKISSALGSQLFRRNVSGARVIEISQEQIVLEGIKFGNFGSHSSKWSEKFCYLNVAVAVGFKKDDIEVFMKKLNKLLSE